MPEPNSDRLAEQVRLLAAALSLPADQLDCVIDAQSIREDLERVGRMRAIRALRRRTTLGLAAAARVIDAYARS